MAKKSDEIEVRLKDIPLNIIDKLVRCVNCRKPLIFVYHVSVRDKCDACGGKAKK